jgi:hypothetical protein
MSVSETAERYDTDVVQGTNGRPVPAKVWIGGRPSDFSAVRLPVGGEQGVHVEYTKEGPAAINRQATVSFATRLDETNWMDIVADTTASNDAVGAFTPATVQLYDDAVGKYVTAVYGYVTDVGGNGQSLGGRFRVFGPETLLSSIPANVSFGRGTTLTTALNYVAETFTDEQPLFGDVNVADVSAPDDLDADVGPIRELYDDVVEDDLRAFGKEKGLELTQTFQPNRDTLADVITWIQQTAGARVWFRPTVTQPSPLQLFAAREPSVGVVNADHLGGTLALADADVIPDSRGVNAVTFVGSAGTEILGVDVPVGGDEFPVVTAFDPDLVNAQGGRIAEQREVDIHRQDNLRNYARSEAKDILDETNDGSELVSELAPSLLPYAGVRTAVDVREARDADDPATILTEIERVSHRAYHDDTQGVVGRSTASTSRYVRLSDIETEATTYQT